MSAEPAAGQPHAHGPACLGQVLGLHHAHPGHDLCRACAPMFRDVRHAGKQPLGGQAQPCHAQPVAVLRRRWCGCMGPAPAGARGWAPTLPYRAQPIKSGSLCSCDAEAIQHPGAHGAGDGQDVGTGGASAVGDGQGVLGGQASRARRPACSPAVPARPKPLANPAWSISQAAESLTMPGVPRPGSSGRRRAAISSTAAGTIGLVKKEPVE